MCCCPDQKEAAAQEKWAADHAAAIAHMNLLQSIIARLATNSSSCKTWCISLVTALLGLAGALHAPHLLTLGLVPVVIACFLDMNYLAQERWFRKEFNKLAKKAQDNSYERTDLFSVGAPPLLQALSGFFAASISWSIWPVYGGIVAAYLWADRSGWLMALVTSLPAVK